jgi:hypothetical protein
MARESTTGGRLEAITSSGNYLGTDRLKRALTNAERDQLARALRKHGFVEASVVALRFAYKLTRSRERARDLMGRANVRLVCTGWDPNEVALVKRLCRLVWSEHMNERRETDVTRRAEETFLREQAIHGELPPAASRSGDPLRAKKEGPTASSPEQHVLRLEEERAEDARRELKLVELRSDLRKLRDVFEAKKDDVNVLYLDQWMAGIEDPAKMAAKTGRDPAEFHLAQKRRKRVIERFLAEKNGVPPDDEENE